MLYGPFDMFRDLWINTAMNTVNYKFLAQNLYSEETIEKVISKSYVETKENTSDGGFDGEFSDEIYYAELKGALFKGHIIKIKDPTRINLLVSETEEGSFIEDLIGDNGYIGGINASGYVSEEKRGMVWGYTVAEKKIINKCDRNESRHIVCGMNTKNKLIVGRFSDSELEKMKFLWAVEFGPVLIANGKENEISDTAGGLAPRSAIGQTEDGSVLLVVVDGRRADSLGATYKDMQRIMVKNGAVNAFLLDGGSSASMCFDGKLVNNPSEGDDYRKIPSAVAYK